MKNEQLFDELVKKNIIDSALAEKILHEAELSNTSAEELLYDRAHVDESAIAKVKSALLGAPYKKINPALIPEELFKLIPKDTSQNYRVIPIEKTGDMFVVGMLHPDDLRAQEALRFIAKRERVSLGVYLVTPSDLAEVWRRYLPYKDEIESAIKEMNLKQSESDRVVALEEGARTPDDAPIIKIVASTLRHAVESAASDIHIEPQRNYLRVRFRIDGELHEVASLPGVLSQPVISRVKVLAKLRLDETRMPQDGRFRTLISGREIDFRIATFPTPSGEKVAIRVLDAIGGLKDLKDVGLNNQDYEIVENALNAPFGMILISGPTGSGKSTTLYAMMQKLNSDAVNIVSLEDPVEYFMTGINQSQVKPEIGYTFASGLRQILRQDPDVVMVGEIRDTETASLAVNAALTGHVMLSTIHTNNSIGVIPRFIDLGVPPFLLSSALNIMLAQRLVGKVCQKCRKEEIAEGEIRESIEKAIKELPEKVRKEIVSKFGNGPYHTYRAGGDASCPACKGKGIKGRVALLEVFQMTREVGKIINKSFTEADLWEEARRQEMITLRQDGIMKALEGKVLIEEVLRETEEEE